MNEYEMNQFQINEVRSGNKMISHFLDNCTKDFNLHDLEELRDKYNLFIDQYTFWIDNRNTSRLLKDTTEFLHWLMNKIVDVSERGETNFKKGVDIDE